MDPLEEKRPTVLIVDDTPDNIAQLSALLRGSYRTKAATEGQAALTIARADVPPDLILLDVMMPGMDGYEVCRRLKEDPVTAKIPVIFLTARSDPEDEQRGLDLGAVDYIIKPWSPPIVLCRVRTHMYLKKARDFLEDKSAFLEQEVARRTREINVIQDVTMAAMGSLAETRDNETGNHIRRTQKYIEALALALRDRPGFGALDPKTIRLLHKSAPLHDIGKVGIPDTILLKPARLSPEEIAVMRTHAAIGRDAIIAAERLIDTRDSFLSLAREIAWTHHERWDGMGYPRGLAAEAIPVSGRLMAVADVFDALISKRVYKPAFSHETAIRMIREGAGTQFDPTVVDVFLQISGELSRIARALEDEEGDRVDRGR